MKCVPRTLFVTSYINRGGTSRVTLDLIRYLKGRGHDVALAITGGGFPGYHTEEAFPIFRFSYPRWIPHPVRMPDAVLRRILKRWYASVLGRFQPQVVYCVSLNEGVLDLNSGLSVPVLAHIHAIHYDTMTKGLGFLRKLSSCADHYVASSRKVAEMLESCLGIPKSSVSVFYNGVPIRRIEDNAKTGSVSRSSIGLQADEVVIVGCGAIDFVKGPDLFVRVAAAVGQFVDKDTPWRFLWIGEQNTGFNPCWDGCINLVGDTDLGDRCQFVGYQENVASFFSLADVFLLTSRGESLPLAMMEAMALGKPVVAFPVGGVREVLSYGGGIVSVGLEPDDLGRAVADLIEDPAQRGKLGAQAREVIQQRFDSERQFEKMESFLSQFEGGTGTGKREV